MTQVPALAAASSNLKALSKIRARPEQQVKPKLVGKVAAKTRPKQLSKYDYECESEYDYESEGSEVRWALIFCCKCLRSDGSKVNRSKARQTRGFV